MPYGVIPGSKIEKVRGNVKSGVKIVGNRKI